jgi:hypothetical protein
MVIGKPEGDVPAEMDSAKKIHRNVENTALVSKKFSFGPKYASFEALS